MSLAHPWWLLLIPLTVGLVLAAWRRRGPAVRWSQAALFDGSDGGWRVRLGWLPTLLRVTVLICLAVALSRPRHGLERRQDVREGVAIQLVMDRSSSMMMDAVLPGGDRPLFDLARSAARTFVSGNGKDLQGRPNDAIGLIGFAGFPDTLCPLTHAHGILDHFLTRLETVLRHTEDGTAIGDAVALASARLVESERRLREQEGQPDFTLASKVVILFTDGNNNRGRSTADAAAYAKARGVRVYVIAYVGKVARERPGFLGRRRQVVPNLVDTKPLETLAQETGGTFYPVKDDADLAAVYRDIDALERTETRTESAMDWQERFTPWALAALVVLLLETTLSCTLLRRTP